MKNTTIGLFALHASGFACGLGVAAWISGHSDPWIYAVSAFILFCAFWLSPKKL